MAAALTEKARLSVGDHVALVYPPGEHTQPRPPRLGPSLAARSRTPGAAGHGPAPLLPGPSSRTPRGAPGLTALAVTMALAPRARPAVPLVPLSPLRCCCEADSPSPPARAGSPLAPPSCPRGPSFPGGVTPRRRRAASMPFRGLICSPVFPPVLATAWPCRAPRRARPRAPRCSQAQRRHWAAWSGASPVAGLSRFGGSRASSGLRGRWRAPRSASRVRRERRAE